MIKIYIIKTIPIGPCSNYLDPDTNTCWTHVHPQTKYHPQRSDQPRSTTSSEMFAPNCQKSWHSDSWILDKWLSHCQRQAFFLYPSSTSLFQVGNSWSHIENYWAYQMLSVGYTMKSERARTLFCLGVMPVELSKHPQYGDKIPPNKLGKPILISVFPRIQKRLGYISPEIYGE